MPFINTSEATKKSSDPTENGKCTYVTNRRISNSCGLDTSFPEVNSLTALSCSSFCIFFLLSQRIFREPRASSLHFLRILYFANLRVKTNLSPQKDERYRLTFDWRFGTLSQSEIRVHWWTHNSKKPHEFGQAGIQLDSSPILSRLCHSRSRLRYQNKSTRARNPAGYPG